MNDPTTEDYPLLVLSSPHGAIAEMLNDIKAELGDEVVAFLREAGVWGRVMAVLLECKCAGLTPKLLEAVLLAGVEGQTAPLFRKRHFMEFDKADLSSIIEHAIPAMTAFEAASLRREAAM